MDADILGYVYAGKTFATLKSGRGIVLFKYLPANEKTRPVRPGSRITVPNGSRVRPTAP
ncbi:hypothetical protein MPLB_250031 [Mesorhizobium sp. ORS 3324]|nr:hypothetical protein MPLB_250031 [Mesorhizobium sp. ORS 3324]